MREGEPVRGTLIVGDRVPPNVDKLRVSVPENKHNQALFGGVRGSGSSCGVSDPRVLED